MRIWFILAITVVGACKDSAEAPATFADPLMATFTEMDGDDATYAAAVRALEVQIYETIPVESTDLVARSIEPEGITEDDVANLSPRPDRDPADCLSVGVSALSSFEITDHAEIPLVPDQRPLEPSSPDHYDRTFLSGEDCWADQGCTWLTTRQELTKVYTGGLIPPITYGMMKDFRWVNLAEEGDPRWAFVARSWDDDAYSSENGKNTIWQSYTIELWLPRDGRGYLRDGAGEDGFADSAGGGTLRFLVLWNETELALTDSEDLEKGTIRWGIDKNMQAHEAWLGENAD